MLECRREIARKTSKFQQLQTDTVRFRNNSLKYRHRDLMSDSIVHLSSKNVERSFCTSVPVWRFNAQFELKRELRMGITGILSIKISKCSDFVTYVMMLV